MKKGQSMETITLEEALELFKLPRTLGEYEGKTVSVGVGRFGPYILHNKVYVSLPKGLDPMEVTCPEHVYAKRFGDIGVSSVFQPLQHVLLISQGGQQHDRDMGCLNIGFDGRAKFVPSHFRHHNVRKYQVRIVFSRHKQRVPSVGTGLDQVFLFQQPLKVGPQIVIVLHNKNTLPGPRRSLLEGSHACKLEYKLIAKVCFYGISSVRM